MSIEPAWHDTAFNDWLESGERASSSTFFLYHNWIEHLSTPVVSHRPDGRIEYINPAGAKLLGKRRRDIMTSTFADHLPTNIRDTWWRAYVEKLDLTAEARPDTTGELTIELDFVGPDRKSRAFDVVASVQRDRHGRAGLIWLQLLDASERRKAAALIEERTRRLSESNRDLEDFAYVASHDLQEPLRKISAFSERLAHQLGDDLDERSADYLARITGASERMQGLINDLLSYSRITTKGAELVPINLSQIVSDVLGDLEVGIAETGATIHVGSLPIIDSDATQLRQVFQNLIGNALKFRRMGVAPEIRIEAAAFGSRWLLRVSDNGIGFEEKYAEKIFTVFQRLHGRNDCAGSGIGLAIVRKIIERHGGTIRADVVEGAPGAAFVIDLPRSEAELLSAA